MSEFPLRMATLTPYTVCSIHVWYWSDKGDSVWIPGEVDSLDDACEDLDRRMAGTGDADELGPVWVLDGNEDDRESIIARLAATSGWNTKFTCARRLPLL